MTDENVWTGKWCWTRAYLPRPWNYYAYFRKVVTLPAEPERATVRVSADARYVLFVNGRRVHGGPARSSPQYQSFDTLDLSQYLEVGRNAVCAVVHQFGIPTFFSQYRGASGFLLDGVIELEQERIPLHTADDWLCREAKGWRRDVARVSKQMGFQEHFDADADPPDWCSPDYTATEDEGWAAPHVLGPAGIHPWLHLEPRGVPLLADHVERFTAVVAQFSGENARGSKVTDDVYHFAATETRKREKAVLENPLAMLADDEDATTIPPPPDGHFAMAVLDLGTYRTGHLRLDIVEAAGDEIIDILYAEELDKTQAPRIVGTAAEPAASDEATASRYRCRPGKQRWEAFHYIGMRYVGLIFRNVVKPLKIRRVDLRQVYAAIEASGTFECSDERLTQIWKAAKNTQLNCAFDALVDCPWREQAQWWGDARVEGRITAYGFGDTSLLERGIRQVARSQGEDGAMHAHPPADVPQHILPDFNMTWVGTLWDHYQYTGRTELLAECLPNVRRLFQFLRAHETPEGLIGNFDGWWVFLDWAPLRKENFSAVLNLMYVQSLRWAAAICQTQTDGAGAEAFRNRADAVAAACEKHFWDDAAKVWRDGYDPAKSAPVEEVSQHANALAILLKLKPDTHARIAKEVLLKAAQSKRSKIVGASPFFYAYVLEAMVKAGLGAEAVDVIRDKWGVLLDRGATTFPEHWDSSTGSQCHAWSASPLYHLSQIVLGVTPVEPGWTRVRIAPLPAGLEFARGVVPTPLGPIRVEWEKGGEDQLAIRVDLPEGIVAEFVDPLGESRSLAPGPHEFHT